MTTLPPIYTAMIASFRLSLRAARKAPKTVSIYIDATERHARWLVGEGVSDWTAVNRNHIRAYTVFLQEAPGCWCGKPRSHEEFRCPKGKPLSPGYVNNQYRAVQAFYKWLAREEDLANPMADLSPPKLDEDTVVPLVDYELLRTEIRKCEKGRDFVSRRDAALLRFFACTGCRLDEVTKITIDDVNMETFEALVTGKGGRQRIVKFDAKCAEAIDRYVRVRATMAIAARSNRLWLSTKRCALTGNGIGQMLERRGLGHPHMFRHTFSHRWLDAGGAEGDLMELNDWKSPQMLRRYGRSARSARARRAYDRINVMGDI